MPDQEIAKSDDNFFRSMYGPKPSEKELEERREHIPSHFRALHPEWIEEENKEKPPDDTGTRKVVKSAEEREQDEFNKLKRINTYRRNENPEVQQAREEKERREAEEAAYAKKRNHERFKKGITALPGSTLPNFEDMNFVETGFFKDFEENKRLEAERRLQVQNASKVAPTLPPPVVNKPLPSFSTDSVSASSSASASIMASPSLGEMAEAFLKVSFFL